MRNLLIKCLLFIGIYTLFHFGHDVVPLPVFSTSESIWQHLKIGFFSAITLSLLELAYFSLFRHIDNFYNFALSRLISAQLIVGIIFSLFYLYVGLFYKLPGSVTEIVLVAFLTFLGAFIAYYIEAEFYWHFSGQDMLLLMVCLLFLVINGYLFIKFSNQVPYYPLFTEHLA
ncbi:MAG: hypothetical protein ABRQ24_10005 [Syntrophomonadaceae bacterium]